MRISLFPLALFSRLSATLVASAFFLLVAAPVFAGDDLKISSTITEVNVYRQRAQLHQLGAANVKAGDNVIVFTGLSQYIIPNSVSVKGEGKGIIQSVRHRVNYLSQTAEPVRVVQIRDSIRLIGEELSVTGDELFVYAEEEKAILRNGQLGSEHEAFGVENIHELADFYRKRLTEVRILRRGVIKRQTQLNERIVNFNNELVNIQAERAQPTQEVVVAFKADAASSIKLELTYLVTGVSWDPFYDVRVANTASPIALTLKATVTNNTGIDWKQVKLTLSTAQNDGSHSAPILNPQYVYMNQPVYDQLRDRKAMEADSRAYSPAPAPAGKSNSMDYEEDKPQASQSSTDYTTVSENTLALEFDISIPYDIPADGKGTQVDIYTQDVKGDYKYYSVPKMDCETYLVAYIHQDLLRGKANVYFEGTFVGETFINTDNPQDSMKISLGRDPKVQVAREQVKEFSKRKVIGGNIEQTSAYQLTIRNNKKETVTLSLQDQFPVSQNADIKIELLDAGGATVDTPAGKLSWNLTLQPGEKKVITFRYEATYPKESYIQGL